MAGEKAHNSNPTPDEAAKANAGKYDQDTKILKKVAGIGKFLIPLAGTAGAGIATVVVLDRTVPAIHEKISSTYHDTLRLLHIEKDPVPLSFDNSQFNGIAGDNNVLDVSYDTLQRAPKYDEHGNVFLYITPPKPGETVTYSIRTLTSSVSPGDTFDENTAKQVNTYIIEQKINKEDKVPMPVEGGKAAAFFDNKGNFLNIWVYYKGPDGKEKRLTIAPADTRTNLLQDLPKITPETIKSNGININEFKVLEHGAPLLGSEAEMTIRYSSRPDLSVINQGIQPTTPNIVPLSILDSTNQPKAPRLLQNSS